MRHVHQYADEGHKISRILVHMVLQLHVDASLNIGGLVGSLGGYICGVTDKTLLDGCVAPWSPMAWRSFKMSCTVPSSLCAETQAVSVARGLVEWAILFLQELVYGQFYLQGAPAVLQEKPEVCVTDCTSFFDHLSAVGSPSTLHGKRSAIDVLIIRRLAERLAGCSQDYNWQTALRKTRVRSSNTFAGV